ncbi:MAG: response regulator [Bdellovibrionales bacterium]|nr:response regulator [Bdellovibrionales bacterium]
MADDNDNKKNNSHITAAASDLEIKDEAKPEVIDINTLQVRVLIVCQKVTDMENVVHYLIRRGWEAIVVGTIREAFQLVGSFNPDFVLLSVNLKTAKLAQIPTLINHTFKVEVITFGENQNPITQKRLQDIACQHTIVGGASGPGIHRKIKNILIEMMSSNNEEAKSVITRAHERKIIKGDIDGEKPMHQQKRGYTFTNDDSDIESKEDKLRRQFEEADRINSEKLNSREARSRQKQEEDEQNYGVVEKKFALKNNNLGRLNKSLDTEEDDNGLEYESHNDEELSSDAPDQIENIDQDVDDTDDNDIIENEGDISEEEESLEDLIQLAKANNKNLDDGKPITTRTHAISSTRKDLSMLRKQGQANNSRKEVEEDPNPNLATSVIDNKNDTNTNSEHVDRPVETMEHFIIQSARKAAGEVKPPTESLEHVSKCTVWPVTCTQMVGFIVVSHGGSKEEENTFNDKFIHLVQEAGLKMCSTFEVSDHVITNLEHVDLKQHVEGEQFTATVSSGKNEIIIKLIEAHQNRPKIIKTSSPDRAQVDVGDLVPELQPGADLYLYMPKNNRFFIYLKMNGILSTKQKDKLESSKASIFINSKDVDKYSKAYVKNTTVQKIRDLKLDKKKAS